MAAEWYYLSNQKQVGPIEFQALQGLARTGLLAGGSLVFGPGLTEWTVAGQVNGLFAASPAVGVGSSQTPSHAPSQAQSQSQSPSPAMLGYRGLETSGTGISPTAMDMLRQTKPWVRLIGVLLFILAGLMLLGGIGFTLAGATMGSRMGMAVPGFVGIFYAALGALYLVPALFLNRYASRIGDLMRSNRMSDLEQALGAQKSFWKFVGIVATVILSLYVVMAIIAVVILVMR